MASFRFNSLIFTLLLAIASTDAFSVLLVNKPTTPSTRSASSVVLEMTASTPPPPPPAEVKVSPSSAATTAPATSATNLPSQQELAQKAKDVKAPSAKSTNVASGAGLIISSINFDGQVPKTEADEYVVVTNKSSGALDIGGYYIYVATTGTQGPTFYFPKGAVIKPNQSLRIYTNEIHPETGGYSYGSGKAIWSNNGGLAVLKDSNGKKLTEFKYKPSA